MTVSPTAIPAASTPASTFLSAVSRKIWPTAAPQRKVVIDETVILPTLSLVITIDTPAKIRGGVQQNDSLVNGYSKGISLWQNRWQQKRKERQGSLPHQS